MSWSVLKDKDLLKCVLLTHRYRTDLSPDLQAREANDFKRLMKQGKKLLGTKPDRGTLQSFRLGGFRGTAISYMKQYGHILVLRVQNT